MAEQSLKDKTVQGTAWTALESVLRYGVSFVVGIILARLLSPDDYGLLGILTIFIVIFEYIINGGLISALIRKQDAKDIDYCTVFYTNLTLSLMMAGVLFASAGIIARFFERPELVSLTRVMSVVVIIHALALVQRARLTKEINFKTQTKVSFIASVTSGVIGIAMAYKGFGVWALVGQQLSNAGMTTILLWAVNRWWPKLQFSVVSFKEMWSYGWKLLVSGVLNCISGQLHHVVIGKCFSPATLGQYTRAHQFGTLCSDNITTVIQRVTFPVLSKIQDDPLRLKSAYRRVIKVTVFPTFVLMMCLAACAKPLLLTLIGAKWVQASYFLQIISFSMMLYPLHALNLNAIQVMGRSDLTLRINIIKNLLIIIPVSVGLLFNIYWMLVADVIRGYLCYYLNAYYTKYVMDYSIREQIKDVFPSLRIALTIAVPLFAISFIPINYVVLLIIQVILGSILFFALCEKRKFYEYMELKSIVLKMVYKTGKK